MPRLGALTAAAVLLLMTACGQEVKVFEDDQLEEGVKQILTENYNISDVEQVDCPDKQEVKQGNTFECEVEIGDDPEEQVVKVTVLDDDGKYEVAPPGEN